MAVWGIGAYDPGKREDKAKLFVDNGMIEVGYTKDEKPMFYRLLHLMDYGDLVFIKAKYSLQGTTQGRYLTGGVPPVRFSM